MTCSSPRLPWGSPACVPAGAVRHLPLTQLLFIFMVWRWDKGGFEWLWTETCTGKLSSTKGRSGGEEHFSKCSQNHSETSSVLISNLGCSHSLQYLSFHTDYLDLWSFPEVFCRRESVTQYNRLRPEPGAASGSTHVKVCVKGRSFVDISIQYSGSGHGYHSCIFFPGNPIFDLFVCLFSHEATFKNNRK